MSDEIFKTIPNYLDYWSALFQCVLSKFSDPLLNEHQKKQFQSLRTVISKCLIDRRASCVLIVGCRGSSKSDIVNFALKASSPKFSSLSVVHINGVTAGGIVDVLVDICMQLGVVCPEEQSFTHLMNELQMRLKVTSRNQYISTIILFSSKPSKTKSTWCWYSKTSICSSQGRKLKCSTLSWTSSIARTCCLW